MTFLRRVNGVEEELVLATLARGRDRVDEEGPLAARDVLERRDPGVLGPLLGEGAGVLRDLGDDDQTEAAGAAEGRDLLEVPGDLGRRAARRKGRRVDGRAGGGGGPCDERAEAEQRPAEEGVELRVVERLRDGAEGAPVLDRAVAL